MHPSGCILVRSDPGLTELIELIETRRFDFVDRGKLAAGSSGTPDGKGRTFKRKHSTFATGAAASGNGVDLMSRQGGTCGCGKRAGGCGGH